MIWILAVAFSPKICARRVVIGSGGRAKTSGDRICGSPSVQRFWRLPPEIANVCDLDHTSQRFEAPLQERLPFPLTALRGPGESYSDVILRLAAPGFSSQKSEDPLIDAAPPDPPSWGGTANLQATAGHPLSPQPHAEPERAGRLAHPTRVLRRSTGNGASPRRD
jgi:hypothetical protein